MASLPAADSTNRDPCRPCQLPIHLTGDGADRNFVQQAIPPKSPDSCGCTQRESWPSPDTCGCAQRESWPSSDTCGCAQRKSWPSPDSCGCAQRESWPSPGAQSENWLCTEGDTSMCTSGTTTELRSDKNRLSLTMAAKFSSSQRSSAQITQGVKEMAMLGEHPGYHQEITGEMAEHRLRQCGGHCYLTRFSKKQGCYVLSVHEHRKPLKPVIKHFKIIIKENGSKKIEGKDKTFPGIRSLLEYYELNRINPAMTSIGHAYTEDEYRRSNNNCTIQ